MLDGNVLLRQKRDEVPEGTLSFPDRNLAVFHHYRHYEGLRLLPSVCDSKLIQQTLITVITFINCGVIVGQLWANCGVTTTLFLLYLNTTHTKLPSVLNSGVGKPTRLHSSTIVPIQRPQLSNILLL